MPTLGGYQFRTEDDPTTLASDAFTWSARGSLTYKLTPCTELQYFQFYRGPTRTEQGRVETFSMANFSDAETSALPHSRTSAPQFGRVPPLRSGPGCARGKVRYNRA